MAARGEVRVAIVGGGIAGLTAALQLSERGYRVTVYEAKDELGGNLSAKQVGDVYHDVYPHMFCDWYVNFWNLVRNDLGLDREAHFEPRFSVKMLRREERRYLDLRSPNTFRDIFTNLRSEILPVPDMFLWGYSLLDLASQPFERREFLSQYSVNGFLRSRAYANDKIAMLHDLVLLEIWSVHGVQTSARAYKDFLKHTFSFPRSTPFAWLLKGNLEEKLIAPIRRELERRGCSIETGSPVSRVSIGNDEVSLEVGNRKTRRTDHVILAVPAEALAKLVTSGDPGHRIVDRVPYLSEVGRLRGEPIPVVDLYFKYKLPDIPREHVGLHWSGYALTFLDISQLWVDDPHKEHQTALVLAASDAYGLPGESDEEDAFLMIKRLHEFLPVFKPGRKWKDRESDIDWDKTHFRSNQTNPLFINEVGSGWWRPQASYTALPRVYFAGDAVPTDVSMATVEAAVRSGLNAARALQQREPRGEPIELAEPPSQGELALIWGKLALTPIAYAAKWWSVAFEAVRYMEKGDVVRGIIFPVATNLSLPYYYVGEWWETAARWWEKLLFDRDHDKKG